MQRQIPMTNRTIGAQAPNPVGHVKPVTHVNEREPQIHGNHQTQRSSPPTTDQLGVTINLETRSTAGSTVHHKSSNPQLHKDSVNRLQVYLERALS